MMRIGIEVSRCNLRRDLLMHPERYFFILRSERCAFLCIRTCDAEGNDIQFHILDAFALKDDGQLHSVFDDLINDALFEFEEAEGCYFPAHEYPLSHHLVQSISKMPDLMDWIITSVLSHERNLIIDSIHR
jgi:hypothetical protein